MSAIFGIINKKGQPVSHATGAMICQAMQHRAIDGQHVWHENNVLIGQSSLQMLATPDTGMMPLISEDVIIAADVLLDNSAYLLEQTGVSSDTSDELLLLHAYRKWGNDCIQHLEGEFVFCIWHKQRQQLLIATDQMGCRALYYYDSPEVFIFSSEQKGILAVKPGPHVFNEVSLIEYYFRQSDPAGTYTKDVHALCAGNMLMLDRYTVHLKKYWTPVPGKYHFKKFSEWTGCLRELLKTAVRNRIRTDRPVGITLSGGLDSSSVACILAPLLAEMNKPLYAFSSVLREDAQGEDERKYIDIIGKACPNIIQTYIHAEDSGPFQNTVLAFEKDEVFPNVFYYMDHAILAAARNKGIGVLFTGYGGDHWVSWKGNPVIYNLISKGAFGSAWRLLKTFSKTERKRFWPILKREYIRHTSWYKKMNKPKSNHIGLGLQDDFYGKYRDALTFGPIRNITASMLENISSGRTGLFPAMLANRNEAYGMRSAVPLLNKQVLEFMMDVPPELFVHGGYKRSILRHAMQGVLPPEVQWRTDKGMYSPDFFNRIEDNRENITAMLTADDYDAGFRYYLSRDNLQACVSKDELAMIRMTQGVISSMVVTALQKKGYVFEDNFS
ncbi:asparagine synthase-related protein [Chitinophaga sp. CF418]|uniref:asparagine synthase-related protein n=1 Tax=Chitinophaga sp. CF418 TaxID=1855287 RepID=UPI00091974A0|nr:asparagine synthase-related protein [Chitinophaga sp. CF418]SHN28886.1 asparagine synthase (glutamine-hydrolysing) [Chitinophaga sp. CF418]